MPDILKIKQALIFFGNNTNPRKLGKVKLLKLFYYSDFLHLKKYGRLIFDDAYYCMRHGPVPSAVKNLIGDVQEAQEEKNDPTSATLGDTIEIQKVWVSFSTKPQHRIVLRKDAPDFDEKSFSKSELGILNEVGSKWAEASGSEIERSSHKEAAWRMTEEKTGAAKCNSSAEIDYLLAAEDDDCEFTKEELKELLQL